MTDNQNKKFKKLAPEYHKYEIEYRVHATRRMFQRDIASEDVELLLIEGDIIEQYEEDFPLPSFLLSGKTRQGVPLHTVIGVDSSNKKIIVITAYIPSSHKWSESFSRRK